MARIVTNEIEESVAQLSSFVLIRVIRGRVFCNVGNNSFPGSLR